MTTRNLLRLVGLSALWVACAQADSERTRLVLAVTTSIEDSGLLDVLTAQFAVDHPKIELSAIAVGTGQAIELARRGDADVIITHDSAAELALVQSGAAASRTSVMYNDFIVAGPAADPARARGSDAVAAFTAIANTSAQFISRGDDSGTHRKERQLWRAAGVDLALTKFAWYVEAGLGQGDALLLAGQKQAYILTDRATYLRFEKRIGLPIICEGDPRLLNHYGVTVMNGPRQASAQAFATWIVSEPVQQLIRAFGVQEFGRSLFIPTAISR